MRLLHEALVWRARSARNNHRDSEDTEGAQRFNLIDETLCAPSVSPCVSVRLGAPDAPPCRNREAKLPQSLLEPA